jgi:ABC-2 type transport system ATP-binding protein
VQQVCDRVGIIRDGELIKTERVETLTQRAFKRVHLTLREVPPAGAFTTNGVTETGRDGQMVMLEVRSGLDTVMEKAVPYGIEDIDTPPVTLEEVFLAFYDRQNHHGGNHA